MPQNPSPTWTAWPDLPNVGKVIIRVDFGTQRAHGAVDRNASSKRPGLQFQLISGTHPGAVALAPNEFGRKDSVMQLPVILEGESLRRLIQGAIVGGLLTAFLGFNWGGWTTQSTARQLAVSDTSIALVAVLAPMCADRFRTASDVTLNMAEFKKVSSWQQDSFIQKGGWATFSGMISPDLAIAQACAKLLTT
jgi:hypothetical protein